MQCSVMQVKVNIHQLTSQADRETSHSQANGDVDVGVHHELRDCLQVAPPDGGGEDLVVPGLLDSQTDIAQVVQHQVIQLEDYQTVCQV